VGGPKGGPTTKDLNIVPRNRSKGVWGAWDWGVLAAVAAKSNEQMEGRGREKKEKMVGKYGDQVSILKRPYKRCDLQYGRRSAERPATKLCFPER